MNNIEIELRERGKLITSRSSHNIWTAPGKTWLGQLISFAAFGPDVWANTARLRYMGFGIGGDQQGDAQAYLPPLSDVWYPGTNVQNNRTDQVSTLERPVYINAGFEYYKEFDLIEMPATYHLRFTVNLSAVELNLGFLALPLSEIGLFNSDINLLNASEPVMAYDVFESVPKSFGQEVTIRWTVRL